MVLLSNYTGFVIICLILAKACFILKEFHSFACCGCKYIASGICVRIIAVVLRFFTARKTTNCESRHRQTNNNLFHGSDFRQQKYNFFINA